MNIASAVTKEYEGCRLPEIADAPVTAIEGIGEVRGKALNEMNVKTVRDLAAWKYYKTAKAIVALAETESPDLRPEGSQFNINKAMDKAFETISFKQILDAPPSALSGLTEKHDSLLSHLQIKTIKDLGNCKYAKWADAITTLAAFDSDES
eukprot:CAMPEP_0117675328 /NCGR_PEP_ID=MMETSP0804-20121206/15543_1 /TAXON_ID=1074897 /ORGANISM="Tetraselmis astigmatica, Strain CCMP880" /LENGTH=150 /DNA_ID=CAMNT_0005484317 /DNA_START=200 /DNA_END=652 /DNA_ORIENTATION=-